MVTMKEISYKDERLGFFADQRKLIQKRYDRLEKQIKPDEPYTSERREFLSDLGRELSFYNDVVEMLEHGATSKSEVRNIFEEIENKIREDIKNIVEHINHITDPDAIDGQYEEIATLEWVLNSVAEIKKRYITE